jgi:hypothetical protein
MIPLAVQYGTLPGWLAALGAFVVALLVYRGGGGGAMAILRTSNEILDKRNHELIEQSARDQASMEGLRASRDFAQALAPVLQTISEHENAHLEALGSILLALDGIANRLDGHEPTRAVAPDR